MSEYKLVIDSCCEVTKDMIEDIDTVTVPYSMTVDDVVFVDDENLDTLELLDAMKKSENCPKSGCPTPFDFSQRIDKDKKNFVITLSSALSACYGSAIMAKEELEAKFNDIKIHVFDTKSASAGETLVYLKIKEFIKKGMSYEQIIEATEKFISSMNTLFVLESLDNLIKNGRMSKLAGTVASLLSIYPIMSDNGNGEIALFEKTIGMKKALNKLVDAIGQKCNDVKGKTLVITHCNNKERAEYIKSKAEKKYDFEQIIINETKGLGTVYANDGGIVIAF